MVEWSLLCAIPHPNIFFTQRSVASDLKVLDHHHAGSIKQAQFKSCLL
jgi:hypothetical protein